MEKLSNPTVAKPRPFLPVIRDIHATGPQVVFEFTGAGSLALAWLHAVAGSSRTILEATDRYCPASMIDLLGGLPEKFAHPATAGAMAERAYLRARALADDRACVGLACTASIATDRPKRGEHRFCAAIQSNQSITTFDLVLAKGNRDRAGEEQLIAELLVCILAFAAGVKGVRTPRLLKGEKLLRRSLRRPDPLEALMASHAGWVLIDAQGVRRLNRATGGIIYCGSFNPLHYGHEALAAAASRVTGLPVTFELTAINADKAALGRCELERRLAQFWRRRPVAVTTAPLFADKAQLFPGCTFLIGHDTAARLVDKRFYANSDARRDAALGAIAASRCGFLVAGRVHGRKFRRLADVAIPHSAKGLFVELSESAFRADVSATELRAAR